MHDGTTRSTGPLRPIELATAAVLAALAVVLTVAGLFLPHLSVIAAMSVVPMGVVAHHHRLRALLVSAFAAAVLCALVAGTGAIGNVVMCAAVGGLVGVVKRRGLGPAAVALGLVVIGPALAGASVGLLAVFPALRKLILKQVVNSWHGVRRLVLALIGLAHSLAHALGTFGVRVHTGYVLPRSDSRLPAIDDFIKAGTRHWYVTVAVVVMIAAVWFAVLGWMFLGAVLERLGWIRAQDRLDLEPATDPPGPLPVELTGVSYRYPGADAEALSGIDLVVGPAEMVALIGDNGSGKSTLARLLAGRPPTAGAVTRPGSAALGLPGGTALVMQHPETQILGVRVADDVVWGLHDAAGVDVDDLLAAVGLAGMGERETSGLSGGELQRLAVAAALARHPRLLVSDESTAMIDETGRRDMTALLRRLPEQRSMAVVHVTHRPEETVAADRVVRLHRGRRVDGRPVPSPPAPPVAAVTPARPAPEALSLEGVSHTYSIGTPWSQSALDGVDLTVAPSEGVLIVGGNGSGKSTLAWIMAGLLRPSVGECRLGGEPVRERIGSVALAFQHARLQLQRPTVAEDLRSAGAADEQEVAAALASVGLDATAVGPRRVDELSGGQQRRVALAGLLSRHPSVVVLDEPMAGLDGPSRESLIDLLADLRRRHGLTVVIISHDLGGMERVCDRTVRLERGRVAG